MSLMQRLERLEAAIQARHALQNLPNAVVRTVDAAGELAPLDCIAERGWPLNVRRVWHRMDDETEQAFEARVLAAAPANALLVQASTEEAAQWLREIQPTGQ